ncbi:ribonuclease P/MRP protein subunit RPP1 [Apostasia shenzhenica]|uniref:Ribonuclease P/MRP protein subunit RPP1 n=1 Tax=Apostasia shenzhenica TaxID=1088818 RepID=A0A2I0A8R7_9ASPA|nr:ribonuclease P/MRP protein subunit RPP1 [Apostasia shenzhenica]
MVKDAVKRGVHFEITYAHLIANGHASLQKSSHPKRGVQEISHVTDDHARRHTLSDAKLLADWTRGKNLIISGSAASLKEVRGPNDVANLVCFLLGLSMERAKAAISGNCRLLVANALRKKDCYFMGAIRIERMLPEEQVDAQEDWFKDWNVWDPISNGKGDFLSLDEMARLFSTASTRSKCQNAINSTSSINGVVPNAPLFSCTNQNLPDYATEIPSSNEVDHYDMVGNLAVKNSKSMIRKFVETAASEDDKPYSNETEMSDNVGRNSSVARTSISAGLLSVTDFSIMDFTHADKINASNVERREVITAQVDADSVLLKFPSGVAEDMDCSSVDTENQISMMNKETMVTVSLQNDAFTEQFLEAGSKTVQRDENSNQYNRCLHEDLYKHPSICESNVLSSSTDVSFNYFPNKMENPEVVPLETSTSNLNGNVGCTNQGRRKYDSTSAVASTKVDLADGSIDSEILGTGGVLLNTSTSSGFTSEAKSKKKRNTASEISLAGKTRRRRKSCHRPYLLTFKSLCKPMFVKKKAWRLRKAKLL